MDNEERYSEIKKEILGDSDEESGSEPTDSDYDSDEEEVAPDKAGITDMTETNLINLRRTIYLTIMNSVSFSAMFKLSCLCLPQLNFEEAVHKLMKINIPEGKEASDIGSKHLPCADPMQIEMCKMIIECCSQERSYNNFYGLIGERFCKLNRVWTDSFQEAFATYYDTIHRYETNKLRNIGRFFGHLLASDGISWAVLNVVHMNEEETTSSSRIFVKIMMQEMIEEMGIDHLVSRFQIPDLKPAFGGMFPVDNPKNTRFAINYFTSIGMGKITEEMRTYLQNAPKMLAAQHAALAAAGGDSSDSDSSSDLSSTDSSDLSDSDSDDSDDSRYRGRRHQSSGPPRRRRYSDDSRSPPRRRRDSPSPVRRRGPNSPSLRSPPRRRYTDDSPPRRRESPPPRRGGRDSPPRRGNRNDSPPRRRYRDDSPPRRARRDDDTPPARR